MKVRDVMTAHPLLATARGDDQERVRQLMDDARVRHVPVVEGGLVVGVWVQGPDGSLLMLGPERVEELPADADAAEAMAALMRDAEVVLVRDEGLLSGILTRADAEGILRTAVGRGIGRRHPRPVVIRIAGPGGSGKTTLIMRTLARLTTIDAVVLQTNLAAGPAGQASPEVVDPSAHWRAGLGRAVDRLADAQLILLEDRDDQPDLGRGIGEDLQVAVLPAAEAPSLPAERLRDAQAIVLTRSGDLGTEEAAATLATCAERWPGLRIFSVSPSAGDPGLDEWVRWIEQQVMRRRG